MNGSRWFALALFELAMLACVLLAGVCIGVGIARNRVAKCQASCAMSGLVCSPYLHGGMDFCVPVAKP